ncbi:Uncharacterized protein APZ42_031719 [Daphnia magna]|uniref:Uncharacterized protein n=1 Tax=Daphnia magna TaxID=35525 RepID=A0A164MK96_9CRUS|nr:Uncharacterized protein APZ42_031719 [Daphnia magna]
MTIKTVIDYVMTFTYREAFRERQFCFFFCLFFFFLKCQVSVYFLFLIVCGRKETFQRVDDAVRQSDAENERKMRPSC